MSSEYAPISQTRPTALIIIGVLSIVFKAMLLFALPAVFKLQAVNFSMFPDGYDLIAMNLAEGSGYRMFHDLAPTMVRTPGYVLVLAALFSVFGQSLVAAQVMNLCFSAGAAVLTFQIGQRVFASSRVAVVAALVCFFHPVVVVADSRGGPESMLLLVLTAMAWLTLRVAEHPTSRHFAYLGAVHGLGMLVKSSVALLLPVACLWIIYRHSDSRRLVRASVVGSAIAIAVSLTCQTPWIVRNYLLSGHFVPTMTVGGVAAFQGQHVVANRHSGREHGALLDEAADQQVQIAKEMGLDARGYFFQQFPSVSDELAFYSELGSRAWHRYLQEPALLGGALVYNAVAFWIQGRTQAVTTANAVIAAPLLLLAAIGVIRYRRNDVVLLALGLVLAYLAPHLFYMSIARYQTPIVPIVVLLAASALARLKTLPNTAQRAHEAT